MAGFADVLVEFLSTENGGRRTPVYLAKSSPVHYRPHFRVLGGNGEYLGIEFVDGPDGPVTPGVIVRAAVRLIFQPEVCYDELAVGAQFEILEGSKVVGTGRVTERFSPISETAKNEHETRQGGIR